MRRAVFHYWLFLLAIVIFLPSPAWSQAPPRVKIFGGISYANISLSGLPDRKNVLGWSLATTVRVHRNVGIAFDFAGQYDPDCADDDEDCLVDILLSEVVQNYSSYQFLAGPEFSLGHGSFEPFAHVLFGGVRTRAETILLDTKEVFEVSSGAQFAMAFGGGVDWSLIPAIGLRIIQVDYIPVHDDGNWRSNIRIQGGFLFCF